METDDLLKRISTRGDVAAASLGFAAGVCIDILTALHSFSPSAIGGLGALVAVGIRNTVQSALEAQAKTKAQPHVRRSRTGRTRQPKTDCRAKVKGRAHPTEEQDAIAFEPVDVTYVPAQQSSRERGQQNPGRHSTLERGLLSDEKLREAIDRMIETYRGSLKEPATSGVDPQ